MTRTTHLGRGFLAAAALTALLGVGTGSHVSAASGGPFSANYEGHVTLSNCTPPRQDCVLHLSGLGHARYLERSRETATLHADLNLLPLQCGAVSGTATLTAAATPGDTVSADVHGQICAPAGGLTGGPVPFFLKYRVDGGTGIFKNASGTGTLQGAARFDFLKGTGTYEDTWRGRLTF